MTQDTDLDASLGRLIGLSGKLRMLSHRVVMFALLDTQAGAAREASRQAAAALGEFRQIVEAMRSGSKDLGISPRVVSLLAAAGAVTPEHARLLDRFVEEAAALNAEPGDDPMRRARLERLAVFVSGDLLTALNEINDGVRRALDRQNATRQARESEARKLVMEAVSQVEQISSSVRLIALNASIEAAKSGAAGRTFAVIAEEIRRLSEQAALSVGDVRRRIGGIGAE